MNYQEFISLISEQSKMNKKEARKYTADLIELLNKTLAKEDLEIPAFGTFLKKDKNKIKFNPSPELLEEINQK
ncbi:MAG: HU family DNA-binding protein [Spirochaetes bacterium]|nr:HU family DNA-binding protein [Spirochaetota bacterium]